MMREGIDPRRRKAAMEEICRKFHRDGDGSRCCFLLLSCAEISWVNRSSFSACDDVVLFVHVFGPHISTEAQYPSSKTHHPISPSLTAPRRPHQRPP